LKYEVMLKTFFTWPSFCPTVVHC